LGAVKSGKIAKTSSRSLRGLSKFSLETTMHGMYVGREFSGLDFGTVMHMGKHMCNG